MNETERQRERERESERERERERERPRGSNCNEDWRRCLQQPSARRLRRSRHLPGLLIVNLRV